MNTTPADPAPPRRPDPFKARQAQDILGYVPHALGFVPAESVVLLSLAGRRLGATLRLDLPRSKDHGTLTRFAEAAAGYLRRHRAADGSLVVVYTADGWDAAGPGDGGLAAPLCAALAAAGLPVRDGWLVGPRYWRGLRCSDPACCPLPGHSIDRIAESVLNTEMIFRGSTVAASAEAALCLPGAAPGWDLARLHEAADGYVRGFAGCWQHPGTFRRTLYCWEAGITSGTAPDQDLAAFLLAGLGCAAVRDALVVQVCLGPDAAYGGALSCGLLTGRRPGPGFPSAARQELPDWRPARPLQLYGMEFARILSGGSDSPPDWRRVETASHLLGSLYTASCGIPKAACGTLVAWLEWARARGSRAQCMIDAVLAECPDYRLAVLVDGLLASGMLPEWSFDPDTAWPGAAPRSG